MFAAHFGQDLNTYALGEFLERRCCEKCANKSCATLGIYIYTYIYISYIRAYARTYISRPFVEVGSRRNYHHCDPLVSFTFTSPSPFSLPSPFETNFPRPVLLYNFPSAETTVYGDGLVGYKFARGPIPCITNSIPPTIQCGSRTRVAKSTW